MKITIEINTDNASFMDGDYNTQLLEILGQMSDGVLEGKKDGKLRDINGNTVGTFEVEGE